MSIPGFDFDFGDTYPGSKTKRTIDTPEVEEDEVTWDGSPKVMLLNGIDVEFFTIGALAEALNRKVVTIRKWERLGYIPCALYREPGERRNRLYTRAQIEGLVRIAREEGLMDPHRHVVLNDTEFTQKAIDLFTKEQ